MINIKLQNIKQSYDKHYTPKREQDNCPPQIIFSFIFSFWLPLSDSMNSIALLYFHFKIHSYLSQF